MNHIKVVFVYFIVIYIYTIVADLFTTAQVKSASGAPEFIVCIVIGTVIDEFNFIPKNILLFAFTDVPNCVTEERLIVPNNEHP